MPRSSSITDLWQVLLLKLGSGSSAKSITWESFRNAVTVASQHGIRMLSVLVNAVAALVLAVVSIERSASIFEMKCFKALLSVASAGTMSYSYVVPDGTIIGCSMSWDSDTWNWLGPDRAFAELTLGGSTYQAWSTDQSSQGLIHSSSVGVLPRVNNGNSLFPLNFKFKRPQTPLVTLRATAWSGTQTVVYCSCLLYMA
jgi:hypothetical protein